MLLSFVVNGFVCQGTKFYGRGEGSWAVLWSSWRKGKSLGWIAKNPIPKGNPRKKVAFGFFQVFHNDPKARCSPVLWNKP